jgi:hypothetical protein
MRFPVLWQGDRGYIAKLKALDCPRSVPWELVAPHEAQAKRNHDQTLKRLAQCGGLAPEELAAVLDGRGLSYVTEVSVEDAVARVNKLVDAI